MAKEIVWDSLTPTEAKTLADLQASGKEIFAAPIEIEHREQLETLGITWADCKTWRIGSTKVIVHLTPTDKATYDMLLGNLRAKHRDEYRKKRCPIPGKLKPTILCPECNKCSECPYPEHRDKHKANSISWEGLIENSYERNMGDDYDGDPTEDPSFHQREIEMELEEVCKVIDAKNPLYTKAIVMKEYYGMSVDEIAKRLGTTKRNVYFYISEAVKIGKQYKEENQ